ncbi:cytochrome c oxidase assembly protein [Arthrobacter crusticola]|uniref:Cytochrome c oxidase assembly protein n=1 Tax=Arthrobacter crusticola TaxID=2547960 RepID=A0A4V3ALV9_9MICC|nr:cytochrome c oxidase assembly protein [Arthrobacter crusticola]TDK24026.1 cytochrome c oxidase assembly protein [Arthrobacter crusticola]
MHEHSGAGAGVLLLGALPFLAALVLYLAAAAGARRAGRPWPVYRSVLWSAGVAAAALGFLGPAALGFLGPAPGSFPAHMGSHLLVGMAAPLLLVLAAPVTLALRTLAVGRARRLSGILRSVPLRVLAHPVPAGVLNTGGLWLLYTTPAAGALGSGAGHAGVQLHFLLAGCLFTNAIIGVDPNPHRAGFRLRTAVLLAALAGHGVLAKYLYAYPPPGVPAGEAETGAYLMYYGGALAEAALITVFCAQEYARAHRGGRGAAGGPVSSRVSGGAAAARRPAEDRPVPRRSRRAPEGQRFR